MVSGALIPRSATTPVIVALGDSRTFGKVTDAWPTNYPYTDVLKSSFRNSQFWNFGISGVKAKDYIGYLTSSNSNSLYPNNPTSNPLNPNRLLAGDTAANHVHVADVALLMIGVNDLQAYLTPGQTLTADQIAQTVWGSIWNIMQFCLTVNPNIKIMLMTLPDVWQDQPLQNLQYALNPLIRQCTYCPPGGPTCFKCPKSVQVVDFAPDSTLYSYHSTTAHYYQNGYIELANEIGIALQYFKWAH